MNDTEVTFVALAATLPRPVESADFDSNGDKAEQALRDAIQANPDANFTLILTFHKAFFTKVGHKRLGRTYVALAKDVEELMKR